MTSSLEQNVIVGLVSPLTRVKLQAAEAVMTRAEGLGLPLHQRVNAVLAEDWRPLQSARKPLIASIVAAMCDDSTDLLLVQLLGQALATEGEDGITELIPLLSHDTFWVRAYAAHAIGSLDNAARWATPALARALDGSISDWTAHTIIRALGNVGGQRATSILQALLQEHQQLSAADHDLLQALEESLATSRAQD